jgi:hypothetical protein
LLNSEENGEPLASLGERSLMCREKIHLFDKSLGSESCDPAQTVAVPRENDLLC